MSVFFLLGLQNRRQSAKSLSRIRNPRGIVRRINQNSRCFLRKHFLEFFKINLKVFRIRRHHKELRTHMIYIGNIFRKKRSKGNDLVAFAAHAARRMSQRARSAAGGKNMFRLILHAKTLIQRLGNRLFKLRISKSRTVAMQFACRFILQQPDHRFRKLFRRRHRRIAQTKIKYILIADLSAALSRILCKFTNNGTRIQHIFIHLRNQSSYLLNSIVLNKGALSQGITGAMYFSRTSRNTPMYILCTMYIV